MDTIKTTKVSFNIVPITDDDKKAVINSLKQYFFRDEPLCACSGLIEENESVIQLENFCVDLLKDGISFMAVSTETGEIMGVSLNSATCRDTKIKEIDEEKNDKSPKFNDIMDLLSKAERDINIFEKYPSIDRIMELKIITVNEAYRGQGVCKTLVNKSKELALELGYQMIYVECSSTFTAMAVERLGFQCIYSFPYSDYVNDQGEVIFKTQPPHKYLKVNVLLL
ncbi:dopamine N-acetyltransferase-like [Melanaphis sacchari]|uniref:dopamine N-acetyltransferase-like n=1 Tax=Melanaphis sacchari TaxID=742174 RepID=UPI000DC1566B|nr:dopamine N-acetyltransferase-like [Melanaphis sacchari]XP_025204684.1 dopamine N-acetyltransferase-like [Melanaphis sacchari]XP_025204686.1 dopamine N-acetyltransferase-like [Melanaphis sacchari]XP_025204687.1 dopamine N-acetyltransferase-like [Melanaphis sacchari]XP_025204688.1 dopamine N-acetyltransferase-like [Melanaphis sacchari]XP_025204689.1 dopamine N-acetyltransferase-like [Melanaphis sacchari]